MHLAISGPIVQAFVDSLQTNTVNTQTELKNAFRAALDDESGKFDAVENLELLMCAAKAYGVNTSDVNEATKAGQEMFEMVKSLAISIEEWEKRYLAQKAIAEKINDLYFDRAYHQCEKAGLSPNLLGIHPHNAMIAKHAGNPWPNVDYDAVEKCTQAMNHQHDGYTIVTAWDKKARNY